MGSDTVREDIYALLASLQRHLTLSLAGGAFQTKDDLLGGLGFLVENL